MTSDTDMPKGDLQVRLSSGEAVHQAMKALTNCMSSRMSMSTQLPMAASTSTASQIMIGIGIMSCAPTATHCHHTTQHMPCARTLITHSAGPASPLNTALQVVQSVHAKSWLAFSCARRDLPHSHTKCRKRVMYGRASACTTADQLKPDNIYCAAPETRTSFRKMSSLEVCFSSSSLRPCTRSSCSASAQAGALRDESITEALVCCAPGCLAGELSCVADTKFRLWSWA